MAKSLKQIEGQASRILGEISVRKYSRNGDNLAWWLELEKRVRVIEARYVTRIVNQDKAVFEAFAQHRTGDWGVDQRLAVALGVDVAENKPYPREVYMA